VGWRRLSFLLSKQIRLNFKEKKKKEKDKKETKKKKKRFEREGPKLQFFLLLLGMRFACQHFLK